MPADISLTPTHITNCVTVNGAITVTFVGDPADYSFEIYNGFGVIVDSLLSTSSSPGFSNLPAGNYSLVAIDIISKCSTNPATITLNDVTVLPTATFATLDQISCDALNPTGQVTATVAGAATDYTFDWHVTNILGTGVGAAGGSDGTIITSLADDTYFLRLTDNTSECANEYYPVVNSGIVMPVVTATTIGSTFCDAAVNGQLIGAVSGVASPYGGYTFNWENVLTSTSWSTAAFTASSLAPGDYNITVIEDATTCESAQITVNISDIRILPTATFCWLTFRWVTSSRWKDTLRAPV